MKKTTLEYYGAVINRAERAMESIEAAKAAYEHECVLAKNALDAGLYGENGYKEAVRKLEADRDAKIEGALSRIDEVSAEYAAEMQELARLDGNRIDEGTMKLLDSGVKLSTEEWQTLANAHKDNYVMTRVLKERYGAAKPQADSSVQSFLTGIPDNSLKYVQFGQTPMDRQEIFGRFAQTLRYACGCKTMPKMGYNDAFASKRDYFNYLAKDSLENMQPFGDEDFGSVDKVFPVETVAAKTTIW